MRVIFSRPISTFAATAAWVLVCASAVATATPLQSAADGYNVLEQQSYYVASPGLGIASSGANVWSENPGTSHGFVAYSREQAVVNIGGQRYMVATYTDNPAAGIAVPVFEPPFAGEPGLPAEATTERLRNAGTVLSDPLMDGSTALIVLAFSTQDDELADASPLDGTWIRSIPEPGTFPMAVGAIGLLALWRSQESRTIKRRRVRADTRTADLQPERYPLSNRRGPGTLRRS